MNIRFCGSTNERQLELSSLEFFKARMIASACGATDRDNRGIDLLSSVRGRRCQLAGRSPGGRLASAEQSATRLLLGQWLAAIVTTQWFAQFELADQLEQPRPPPRKGFCR